MGQAFVLGRGDVVAVHGAGTTVQVVGGGAWVTQYGDINDYFVQDADWASKSDGMVVVHALGQCRVTVSGPAAAEARLSRRGELREAEPRRRFAFA